MIMELNFSICAEVVKRPKGGGEEKGEKKKK